MSVVQWFGHEIICLPRATRPRMKILTLPSQQAATDQTSQPSEEEESADELSVILVPGKYLD